MYNVNVNGQTSTASSYAAATDSAKSALGAVAQNIAERAAAVAASKRLYRSPKARQTVATNMMRSASNLLARAKFPKKAGDVALRVGGVNIAIAKV